MKHLRSLSILILALCFIMVVIVDFYLTLPLRSEAIVPMVIGWILAVLILCTFALVIATSNRLEESEARWKFALEGATNQGVWDWNLAEDTVFYSTQWKSILGYNDDEIGNSIAEWKERIHPDDFSRVMKEHEMYLSGKSNTYDTQMRMRCKDGSYIWIRSRGKIIERSKSKKPARIIGTHTDITAQKASQLELQGLAMIAKLTSNTVLMTDANAVIKWANPGFTQTSGYTLEEVIGKNSIELLQGPDTSQETTTYIKSQLAKREGFNVEILNYSKTGKKYWLQVECKPILDEMGEFVQYMSIESDITDRKRMEELKETFISIISHEIRNPASSIKGALELLNEEKLSEDNTKLVSIALSACQRLLYLLNDLLDSEKINFGKMQLNYSYIDLSELIDDAVSERTPYATSLQTNLKIGSVDKGTFEGDRGRLLQVLSNLISNAVKFSPLNSTVELSAYIKGEFVEFLVEDEGPGIRPINQKRVFERFTPVFTETKKNAPGTGLGLSICKGIIEAHGGTIGCRNKEEGGAVFFFEIPIKQTAKCVN